MAACPTCGHVSKPRKAAPVATRIAVSAMTDAQLFAHYKATAPAADFRFYLAHTAPSGGQQHLDEGALHDAINVDTDQLQGMARPEFYRRLRNLQDIWRRASNKSPAPNESAFWTHHRKPQAVAS